jgi:hypothetical protein
LLVRAALDPWNNIYYHLPFLFALFSYEIRSRRAPVLTWLYSGLLMAVVPLYVLTHISHSLAAALYAVVVVPALAWLSAKLYLSPAFSPRFVGKRRRLRTAADSALSSAGAGGG